MSRQNSIRTGMDVLNLGIERLCEEGRRIKAEEERRQKTLGLVDEIEGAFWDNFHSKDRKARGCMIIIYHDEENNKVTGVVFPFGIEKKDEKYFIRATLGMLEKDGTKYANEFYIDLSKIIRYNRFEIPY